MNEAKLTELEHLAQTALALSARHDQVRNEDQNEFGRFKRELEDTLDKLNKVKDFTRKYQVLKSNVKNVTNQALFEALDANDMFCSQLTGSEVVTLPNFPSEYGFMIPPDLNTWSCIFKSKDPDTNINCSACAKHDSDPLYRWKRRSYSAKANADDTFTIDIISEFNDVLGDSTFSVSEKDISVNFLNTITKIVDRKEKTYYGLSFAINPEGESECLLIEITPTIDKVSLKYTLSVNRTVIPLSKCLFPSNQFHDVLVVDQSLASVKKDEEPTPLTSCVSFSSHKWAYAPSKSKKILGRASARAWEPILFEIVEAQVLEFIEEVKDNYYQDVLNGIDGTYQTTIATITQSIVSLYQSVPIVRSNDVNIQINQEFKSYAWELTHASTVTHQNNKESLCGFSQSGAYTQVRRGSQISGLDGNVTYSLTSIRTPSNTMGFKGSVNSDYNSSSGGYWRVNYSRDPFSKTITHGIDVKFSLQAWPGTDAEATNTAVTYELDGKTYTQFFNPSVTVTTDGKVEVTGRIETGSSSFTLPAVTENETRYPLSSGFDKDLVNASCYTTDLGGGKNPRFVYNIDIYKYDTGNNETVFKTFKYDSLNIDATETYVYLPRYQPGFKIISVTANIRALQSPLSGNIVLIDPLNQVMLAELQKLIASNVENTAKIWSLETRVQAFEDMQKASFFKVVGEVSLGFVGVVSGAACIIGPLMIAAGSFALDAVLNNSAQSQMSAIITASIGVVFGGVHIGRSIDLNNLKFMDSWMEMFSDLSKSASQSKAKFKIWKRSVKTKLIGVKGDPKGLLALCRKSYATPFEAMINENYISVCHTKLSFVPFDAAKFVNDDGAAGNIYRFLHSRNISPSHSELRMNHNYFVENSSFDVNVTAQMGVGTGIGNDLAMSRRMEILGIGNGSNGNSTLGMKTLFRKVDRETGQMSMLRLPPNAQEADLINEASYYYKVTHGDAYSDAGLQAFLDTKPWANASNVYDDAFYLLEEQTKNIGMYMDERKTSALSMSTKQWQSMINNVGEDYMKGSFVYDVINNNCHKYANQMFDYITSDGSIKAIPDFSTTSWFRNFNKQYIGNGLGYLPDDYTDISEIHELMNTFFGSVRNTSPKLKPPSQTYESDYLGSTITDSFKVRDSLFLSV